MINFLISVFNDVVYPDEWRKTKIVLWRKNLIKEYQPISIPRIFSKVLEILTYNSLYNYFMQNELFTI